MLNPLHDNRKENQMMKEEDIPLLHHNLMKVYGWIPYDEFLELPPHVVLRLYNYVNKELEQDIEYKKAVLKGLGYKVR